MSSENDNEHEEISAEEAAARDEFLKQVEEIRVSVFAAFADNVYPGDDVVWTNWGMAQSEAFYFVGHDWKEMQPDDVANGSYVLNFFERAAFQYYLPAVLIACMTTQFALMELIYTMFVPPSCTEDQSGASVFKKRFEGLTDEQYRCIALFIVCYKGDTYYWSEAEHECIQNFWASPHFELA